MEIVNNKDQTVLFKLKEFDCDSLGEVKVFQNNKNEKLFEVGYDLNDCPVFIRIKHEDEFDDDYLASLCVEEINFGKKDIYAIPFVVDYDLLHTDKISIHNKGDIYVCLEKQKVKGLLIQNIELYNFWSLVAVCNYQKRDH